MNFIFFDAHVVAQGGSGLAAKAGLSCFPAESAEGLSTALLIPNPAGSAGNAVAVEIVGVVVVENLMAGHGLQKAHADQGR